MPRSAAEIRRQFIDFFREKYAHTFVPSSPVVPHDDPTLMFTNAGMNQFKPIFLGQHAADVDKWRGAVPGSPRRAVNTQKCIRAGGKHNDLDDVGHDTYHHTFFEMLGNWSFGDYFKKEAIEWAWELLTKVWGIDPERLHATYFGGLRKGAGPKDKPVVDDPSEPRPEGRGSAAGGADWELEPDCEARDLWLKILPPERVHPGNMKDNFWEMGDTGPCGPCSEVHIDLTPDKSGGKLVNAGDARVMEIWNLVFIQFNRGGDGKLTPLPAKHVDTGMGFERITAVIRGTETGRVGQVSNYDTDVFAPIFVAIQKATGAAAYGGRLETEGSREQGIKGSSEYEIGVSSIPRSLDPSIPAVMVDVSYRVIADHIRTLTFAITDGAMPDKEGRGYVLRRILRRAVRYGWQYLNVHKPFLCELVPAVVDAMSEAFPELRKNSQRVMGIIRNEEESFERTLERGIKLFNFAAQLAEVDALGYKEESVLLSGDVAFQLHDTFGFPIDLTEIMARERGITVDIKTYERLMEEARTRARGASADIDLLSEVLNIPKEHLASTTNDSLKFNGHRLESKYLFATGWHDDRGDAWTGRGLIGLVFDQTCFYAEQGGQVGDHGWIDFGAGIKLSVNDTKRSASLVVHLVDPSTLGPHRRITPGQTAVLEVDDAKRRPTMQNHTATHVMNWALREVVDPEGLHLQQKGSLVDPEKTRFDFSHPKPLTPEEIERVEKLCEKRIAEKLMVFTNNNVPVAQVEAMKINGLRAVFGEKYPEMVRVVSIGVPVTEEDARAVGRSDWLLKTPDNPEWRKYSIEFCGGTHVKSTGEIAHFVLTHEEAVAKGVRRIVGVSGQRAKLIREAGAAALLEAEALRSAGGTPERGAGDRSVSAGAAPGTFASRTDAIPAADFAARVARLQKDVDGAELPVLDRLRLRELLAELAERVKKQQKAAAADMAGVVNARVDELLPSAEKRGATTMFVAELPDAPVEQLKGAADRIKQKCGSAAIFIGVRQGASEPGAGAAGRGGKVMLLAAVTDDLIKKGLKAGDLVKAIAPIVEGGGGGPPTMAQAGGKNAAKLPEALDAARAWVAGKLDG